jgi:hypothetical protein
MQGLLLMDMSNTVANFAAGFAASQIGATAAAITGKSVTDLAATSVVLAQGNSVRSVIKIFTSLLPFSGFKRTFFLISVYYFCSFCRSIVRCILPNF